MFSSGDSYESFMGRHSRKLAPLFADFAQVRDQGLLLDVGCGTGSLTQVLVDRTRDTKITGIDPSKAFVGHARACFAENPRVSIDEGSATMLPYADNTFDQSVTLLVLMFIADAEKAISELVRVTKPGGKLAACVWSKTGYKVGEIFQDEARRLDPGAAEALARNMPHPYVDRQLTQEWRNAGLKDVAETSIEIQMAFDNFDRYWQSQVTGGGPAASYMSTLAPEHMERLRQAVRKRHIGGRRDGPYSLPAVALAVSGVVHK